MAWGKKKHLYFNRSMCWFTELSPAGSVCACELMSSWPPGTAGVCGRWLLGRGGSAWGWVMVGFRYILEKGSYKKGFERKLQGAKRKNSFIVITRE